MTPFEAKGWKATDKFKVIVVNIYFGAGEIVTLKTDDGSTCPSFVSDCGESRYIRLCDLERIEPQWNGEGLPPVGTVCEVIRDNFAWSRATILFISKTHVVFINAYNELSWDMEKHEVKFRPIRTEREKSIDEMLNAVKNEINSKKELVSLLYDAGYRKV